MLLMPQKKKIATIIVSRLAQQPSFVQRLGEESKGSEYETPEDESMAGLEAAMDSFKRALDDRDTKGMARALKEFIYLCEGHEGPESMEI